MLKNEKKKTLSAHSIIVHGKLTAEVKIKKNTFRYTFSTN